MSGIQIKVGFAFIMISELYMFKGSFNFPLLGQYVTYYNFILIPNINNFYTCILSMLPKTHVDFEANLGEFNPK